MLTTQHADLSIADLLRGDLQLTTPPNIYFELQKATRHPTQSLEYTAFIIEKDPALTLQLLKIVNSAFYGFPSQIICIKRAVAMIGTTELQNLVLAAIIIDKFSNLPGGMLSMDDFWAKSLRCALISKELGIVLKSGHNDVLFVCGLLHNIGQLVFLRRIPELTRTVALMQQEFTDAEEISIEETVIGFNHYQTGAALAELWKLPDVITETIRQHTEPDANGPFQVTANIVKAANDYSRPTVSDYHGITHNLDLSAETLAMVMEKSQHQFEAIFRIFYPS
ncbi:MAG: HDOD domain-containing protein [Methylovulum sp.]|nr:HDOD domain-containing protein [Methylovulum sp.]